MLSRSIRVVTSLVPNLTIALRKHVESLETHKANCGQIPVSGACPSLSVCRAYPSGLEWGSGAVVT